MPDLAQCLSPKCRRPCARRSASIGSAAPPLDPDKTYLSMSRDWDGEKCGWFWEREVEVSDA